LQIWGDSVNGIRRAAYKNIGDSAKNMVSSLHKIVPVLVIILLFGDKNRMKIGAHVSIQGGIVNAPANAASIGCECFQLFTRSPRGGPAKDITPEIAAEFRLACAEHGQESWYIHTPYYINLASTDRQIAENSVKVVREELERGCAIGAKAVMTHMGATGSSTRDEALKRVVRNVKRIQQTYKGDTRLLLEIAAGSGSIVGSSFEELVFVARGGGNNCGVCLDTQHMFASGYDIRTRETVRTTFDSFDEIVGLESLALIHTNDSKVPFDSRRDRHEHIGDGEIGRGGFEALLSEKRITHIDLILETRHDRVEQDIRVLKSIRK
jgi:deoxyribonuclease-4